LHEYTLIRHPPHLALLNQNALGQFVEKLSAFEPANESLPLGWLPKLEFHRIDETPFEALGERITPNARRMKGVPATLPEKLTVSIRAAGKAVA